MGADAYLMNDRGFERHCMLQQWESETLNQFINHKFNEVT